MKKNWRPPRPLPPGRAPAPASRRESTPRRERLRRPRAWAVAAGALLLAGGCALGSGGTQVDALASALDADLDTYWAVFDPAVQVRAVLVLSDGEPVLERYTEATEQDRFDIRSVTKSVSATLIGIAIDQGHLTSVEQTLGELLPDYAADMSPAVAAITLRRVLTHTAGFPLYWGQGPAFWQSEDWVGTILRDLGPRDGADGKFRYSDAGAHLLAAILVQATGQPVLDYARTNLFDPLGIPTEPAWEAPPDGPATTEREFFDAYNASGDFAWPVDPQGHHTAWSLLKLRPQDLARLGQLYLNQGKWNGHQIVSASWIQEATTEQTDTDWLRATTGYYADAYGYMWWLPEIDSHATQLAFGYGGQMIAVIPDLDLVVVLATEFDELDPEAHATLPGPLTALNMIENAILPHVDAP